MPACLPAVCLRDGGRPGRARWQTDGVGAAAVAAAGPLEVVGLGNGGDGVLLAGGPECLVLLLFSCCSLSVFLLLLLLSLSPFLCRSEQTELKGRKRGEGRGGEALSSAAAEEIALSLSLSLLPLVHARNPLSSGLPHDGKTSETGYCAESQGIFPLFGCLGDTADTGRGSRNENTEGEGEKRHKKREKIVFWQISREKNILFIPLCFQGKPEQKSNNT